MGASDIPFTKQMRKATREIHDVSDALVNAKLAVALSNDSVWAEGLLIFYEVFRYLEEAMDRLKDTHIGDLKFDGMRRTEGFKEDLDYYLGENWTETYAPRESVMKYLMHLRELESNDPDMLMAYIFHLYMGLLSGGQILRKKRQLVSRYLPFFSSNSRGDKVTEFGEASILSLKKQMNTAMNDIAQSLSDEQREKLIEESKMVFELNNQIIRTVRGTNRVVIKKLVIAAASIAVISVAFNYLVLRK
ncbi:heme oxygenase 2 [Ischnura elegans]|uniref:heme oxygenase 2 n=1 Tax=Ischnura elegans TaxID=197161 RepID=UPI001ED86B72|nr:heme oxygenase 2 [Ischnura elegans]